MSIYYTTIDDLDRLTTKSLKITLEFLHRNQYLGDDEWQELDRTLAIVHKKKSFWSAAWRKIFGSKEDDIVLQVIQREDIFYTGDANIVPLHPITESSINKQEE